MTDATFVSCYIGLGSNLNTPLQQLILAVDALDKLPHCHHTLVSSFYCSKPMGPQDQPDYVNAVVKTETTLSPLALLDQLQAIENNQGRERIGEQWGPRTLDLDLLLYGEMRLADSRLTVPHYGLAKRNFVLYPLAELVGKSFTIPGLGQLGTLLLACPKADLVKINN